MRLRSLALVVVLLATVHAVGQGLYDPNPANQSLGNLTVTGQVTRGFSFRQRVPYAGVNELSLRLPSEQIDDFTRDSVGLDRLRTALTYRPQAFTAASRATYMLRTQIRPATADPVSAAVSKPLIRAPELLKPMVSAPGAAFQPILSREEVVGLMSRAESPTAVLLEAAAPSAVLPMVGERPGVSALFGMMREAQRRKLSEEMLEAEPEPAAEEAEPEPAAEEAEPEGSEPGPQGVDVFTDMLLAMTDRSAEPSAEPGRPATVASPSLERLDVDPTDRALAQRSSTALVGEIGRGVVLRNLGGSGVDRFNRLMAQGDRLMAAGRFYQAANRYETARTILRSNPLPALGAGLAYLGAGESFRASYYLRLSIRIHPEMTDVRVDIDKLVGKQAVDRRLAELTRSVGDETAAGDMPILFLLTFIHANRGQTDEARMWAERLAPYVAAEPRLHAYAEHFLAPAMQPAEQEE